MNLAEATIISLFKCSIPSSQLVLGICIVGVTFLWSAQNTQNRDTQAIQIELDELIRATHGAHNALLDLEELDEDALDAFRQKYQVLAASERSSASMLRHLSSFVTDRPAR